LISPETLRWWSLPEQAGFAGLSLDPANTRIYLAFTLAYLSVFCFVLYFAACGDLLKICYVLLTSAFFQALVGIFLYSIAAQYSLFHFDIHHTRVLGTFTYHNHTAGYFELGLSVGLGLIVAQLGEASRRHGWKALLLDFLYFLDSPKMKLRLMMVVVVIALVLTRSRMGNAGFFAAMLVATVIFMLATRKANKSLLILVFSMVLLDLLVVGSWVGLEKVAQRIENTSFYADAPQGLQGGPREESVEERLLPASSTWPMVRDYRWLGSGAGTFYSAFTPYKPAAVQANYDHAHNDYVELLTDLGVVGAGFLAALVITVFVQTIRTLKLRQSAMPKGVALGCLMATISLAIHSLVDFNLQLPTNALTFVMILAMGWASFYAQAAPQRVAK
jgi:putative inorganic carbon (hco3(-)) transporter